MGLFDTIKRSLTGAGQDEYEDEDRYYEDEEYYEEEYQESYDDDQYYDDAAKESVAASKRRTSVFNDYTPLVSMSDVRAQELPPYSGGSSSSTVRQKSNPPIRTSLPYVAEPTETAGGRRDNRQDTTGSLRPVDMHESTAYGSGDASEPLHRKPAHSGTGGFSVDTPSYYASRSGVGHVRPAGQARRTQKFREVVTLNPKTYADAEQISVNLRRGNAVVLVLSQIKPELAKRILDFSFGAAAMAEGKVESIGERIYALTTDYTLTDNEMETLKSRGIL